MNRVREISTDGDIRKEEVANVFRQRRAKCIAGRGMHRRPSDDSDIGWGRRGLPECARGLACRLDRGPTSNESGDDSIEEGLRVRMLMIEKFDLDLSETGDHLVSVVKHDDAVIDELEERCAIAGMQNLRGSSGAHRDLGDESLPADEWRDDVDEGGWNRADSSGEER
jgi:hypothetical protein